MPRALITVALLMALPGLVIAQTAASGGNVKGREVDAQGLRTALEQRSQAQKAADDEAAPAIDTNTAGREGTTVVGDRESPIGLYITPWRNASPEAELDRPARFLQEELIPLDADVFRRQLEYYNTITDHLAKSAKPPAPATR